MSTNPLMPCGVEQKNQGRARVKIAVLFVLAVHVVVLGALLMQGCKRETEQLPAGDTNTPPVIEPTNLPTSLPPAVVPTNPPPIEAHIESPAAGVTEYKVVKGDSFYTIAKKFHTTMKAIQDANPRIDPKKLQPGQTIKIKTEPNGVSTNYSTLRLDGRANVYEVKSGDTLSAIATKFHTTIKALRAANSLTTDRIKVGQKLEIPAGGAPVAAPVETVPVPAPATPVPIAPPSR